MEIKVRKVIKSENFESKEKQEKKTVEKFCSMENHWDSHIPFHFIRLITV